MQLVDTHCHIHFADYPLDPDEVLLHAHDAGVTRAIVVGCTLEDSISGVDFVSHRHNVWASIGLHPHEAKQYVDNVDALEKFAQLASKKNVVAVGECGLDYFYGHSPKQDQEKMLRFQIELALQHNLPLIFHVRDAFDDFWPIFDSYTGIRGVIHSFSATEIELQQILSRENLYVGLNGIMTFTKKPEQLAAAKAIPLNRLLIETDAPYLTPVPYRGSICEPKHVRNITKFLAELREETLEDIAKHTTKNAQHLFNIT